MAMSALDGFKERVSGPGGEAEEKMRGGFMQLFEGAIIRVAKGSEIDAARANGTDISYTDNDRHIEAYLWNDKVYVGQVQALPGQ